MDAKLHKNEKLLISALENSVEPTTTELIKKSYLSKVTALKYLHKLKDSGIIEYRTIGPSKVWSLNKKHKKLDFDKLKPRMFGLIQEFEELTGSKASILVESNGLDLTTRLTSR